jgi:hypothetical protein
MSKLNPDNTNCHNLTDSKATRQLTVTLLPSFKQQALIFKRKCKHFAVDLQLVRAERNKVAILPGIISLFLSLALGLLLNLQKRVIIRLRNFA